MTATTAAEAKATQPDAPNGPERDGVTGRFLPGNLAALTHALRTDRLPAEFAGLLAEVREYVEQSVADDGGASEIGARRLSLHTYRARVHRRVLQLDSAIEIKGLFDRRGKLRVAWLQQLQSLINTAKGIDSLLGLERRTRRVGGLQAVLSAHEDEDV